MPTPKCIVMAGGGAKGQAYGPAIRMLCEANVINSVDTIIGSSVGGLCAAALALGFSADEIDEFLKTGGDGLMDTCSTASLFKPNAINALQNVSSSKSVAKGHALFHAAQATVASKLSSPNATFKDLRDKRLAQAATQTEASSTRPDNDRLHDLELTVTVDDPRGAYQIVCSAQTTPNMPIALAMRMTAGLPPVFPEVKISAEELQWYTQGATEPLVKYNRGQGFCEATSNLNNDKEFYNLDDKQKAEVIKKINQDMIDHSFKNGHLHCSDGGVVDNLPVYLADNKPQDQGGVDKTLVFNLEEPWKRNNRIANKALYQPDAKITKEDEVNFINTILNVPENDRAYHLYQNTVMKSRLPDSYYLTMLQQNSMLGFDTGDISASDFDLVDVKNLFGKVILSHEQKVAFLQRSGYEATREYLISHGYPEPRPLNDMYPPAEPAVPSVEQRLMVYQKIDSILTSIIEDLEEASTDDLSLSRSQLRESLTYIGDLFDTRNQEEKRLDTLMNKMTLVSLERLTEIVEAKKQSDKLFQECENQLGYMDKLKIFKSGKKNLSDLEKDNPVLAQKYKELIQLKRSSKLLESMLSLVRLESVDANINRAQKQPSESRQLYTVSAAKLNYISKRIERAKQRSQIEKDKQPTDPEIPPTKKPKM